jgi:membrane fusion protein, multidrug efflux system
MTFSKYLFLAVILAACAGPAEDPNQVATQAPDLKAGSLVKVGVLTLAEAPFNHSFPVQGNVETDRNANVIPEFQGAVEKIFVQEGAHVKGGDAILKINDAVLKANREELLNQLNFATDLRDRQERIWSQNIGKEVDYLQAKSAVESIEKSLSTLDATIEKSIIRAPFSGIVDRIFVKRGELASPAMPCVRVIDLSELYVRAMVSDNYVGSLKKGGRVMVEISGQEPVASTTRRIGSYINPANRSVDITVDLPKSGNFIPNMVATLWITDLDLPSAISLPSALVTQDSQGRDFVFVYSNGTALKRILDTGITSEGRILIKEGLVEGEMVINRGGDRLMDGDQVSLIAK